MYKTTYITETSNKIRSPASGTSLNTKEKYYYYIDQYEEQFSLKKNILDPKHCRRGGFPNATESCNENKCPGNETP